MSFAIEKYETREDWLAHRSSPEKPSIGGSAAPVILGLVPWASPFSLWAEMTGKTGPQDDSLRLRVGLDLEPRIESELVRERELTLLNPGNTILRSAERPWQHCTPDRLVIAQDHVAPHSLGLEQMVQAVSGFGYGEFKTVEVMAAKDWDTEPAKSALVQVQHGLSITGWDGGYIAALIGFSKFKSYEVERHQELIDILLEAEADFLQAVVSDIPPETDSSDATKRALAQMFPEEHGSTVVLAGEEWSRAYELFQLAKTAVKEAQDDLDGLKNQFRLGVGDAARAVIPGVGALTFKTVNKQAYTVKATSYRELRESKLRDEEKTFSHG